MCVGHHLDVCPTQQGQSPTALPPTLDHSSWGLTSLQNTGQCCFWPHIGSWRDGECTFLCSGICEGKSGVMVVCWYSVQVGILGDFLASMSQNLVLLQEQVAVELGKLEMSVEPRKPQKAPRGTYRSGAETSLFWGLLWSL